MLALAARRCEGHANVTLCEADVSALPVADASCDAAISVQVLEYVADIPPALAEMRRALRPGGRLVAWDVDWATLSLRTDDHRPDPARPAGVGRAPRRIHRCPRRSRRSSGRRGRRTSASTATRLRPPSSTADTYGGFLVPFIARFVVGRDRMSEDEAGAWEREQRELARRGEFFFACIQCCFTATRPG